MLRPLLLAVALWAGLAWAGCPPRCSCRGRIIQCPKQDLAGIHFHIPRDTEELWMSSNRISSLQAGTFRGLTRLTVLNLAHNELTYLPAGVFDELKNLRVLNLNNNKLKFLREGTFDRLPKLKVLHLHENQLRSLPEGCLDRLESLEGVHLHDNPWDCGSCTVLYLSHWLSQNTLKVKGAHWSTDPDAVRCSGGVPGVPGVPVRSVDAAALGGDSHCQLGAWGSCPDACTCVGNAVDCSYRGLPSVPAEIPVNTEVLWLNDNSIRNVSATALSKLSRLTRLYLSNNELEELAPGSFDDLRRLEILRLGHNSLSTLPGGLLDRLAALQEVYLHNNPWGCGCGDDEAYLRRWVSRNAPRVKVFAGETYPDSVRCAGDGSPLRSSGASCATGPAFNGSFFLG